LNLKVFGYNGSNRGMNSIGEMYFKDVIKNLESYYSVKSILRDYKNTKIKVCDGCSACFDTLKFPCRDEMDSVRSELLDADIIFLISPVYVHSVSGSMKIFLDKIALWTHLMSLSGKFVVIVSVSASNGNQFVVDYLKSISEYLGMLSIQEVTITELSELSKSSLEKTVNSYAKDTARRIERLISSNDYRSLITSKHEEIFNQNKEVFASDAYKYFNKYEHEYWNEISKKYLTFDRFFAEKCKMLAEKL